MIEIKNVSKNFGPLKVLDGVNLEVNRGEIISIIGPSGAGKSTLLRSVIQLESIDEGDVEIEGLKIVSRKNKEDDVIIDKSTVRGGLAKMGMVFQGFNLFPHMTVIENVMVAQTVVKNRSKHEAREKAKAILSKVGLTDKENSYPSQISGGQKQRVAIARALAIDPDIMLFDEPTSALDPELIGEVLGVIKALALEHMTMMIVTHEMNFARGISDRIIFMEDGKIIESGHPDKIFVNPEHPRIKIFLDKILS
jgi:polar amino acid transport system ATP-binding protein